MSSTADDYFTVGEVARMFGVTVRTLHHWESQGLLVPEERSGGNYRLYGPEECQRVEQILIYRATGMPLAEIRAVLSDAHSHIDHLQHQRAALLARRAQLDAMVDAVDELLEDVMNDKKLSAQEVGEILGNANFAAYQEEAEEKYGDTPEWAESAQRTNQWSASDWKKQKESMADIDADLAAAVRNGVDVTSDEARALVERHRDVLSAYFSVTPKKHYLISRGYIADKRFKKYYDDQQEGLAQWLADAIAADVEARGIDVESVDWQ